MQQVVPVGVVVVIIYCWEQPLNWGGVVTQNPTIHTLLAVYPLCQWGGKHLWEPTPCPPSLTSQNQQTGALLWTSALMSLLILRRQADQDPGEGNLLAHW